MNSSKHWATKRRVRQTYDISIYLTTHPLLRARHFIYYAAVSDVYTNLHKVGAPPSFPPLLSLMPERQAPKREKARPCTCRLSTSRLTIRMEPARSPSGRSHWRISLFLFWGRGGGRGETNPQRWTEDGPCRPSLRPIPPTPPFAPTAGCFLRSNMSHPVGPAGVG